MARSINNSTLHNNMVKEVVNAYAGQRHKGIKADHINYNNGAPNNYNGHIPDITAIHADTNQYIFCEIETPDTINTQETYDQLSAFRNALGASGLLHIGLPYLSDLAEAKRVVRLWRIRVDQWWYVYGQ